MPSPRAPGRSETLKLVEASLRTRPAANVEAGKRPGVSAGPQPLNDYKYSIRMWV